MFDGACEDTSEEKAKQCCAMAVQVLTVIPVCAQNGINGQTKVRREKKSITC